jgi:hypothetical protein
MTDVKAIREVLASLKPKALGGVKIPHGMSNPVLRSVDGKVVIAVFIYTYNKENLDKGMMPRPAYWMTSDIATGEMLEHIDCRKNDFSGQSYDKLYSMTATKRGTVTAADFAELYGTLDAVRKEYAEAGNINKGLYDKYLNRILEITPDEYAVFYKDLSNI